MPRSARVVVASLLAGALAGAVLVSSRLPSAWSREEEGIGTPHRIEFVAGAPDGSWVVVRQARRDTDRDGKIRVSRDAFGRFTGDEMQRFLVVGSGGGEAIDFFGGCDPTGRWVAVVQRGKLWLIDFATGAREDLSAKGADARDDGMGRPLHRATSFDGLGRYMTWMRRDGERWVVVVRKLGPEKQEHVVDPGEGLLYRAVLTPDGERVRVEVIAKDTDEDGRQTWPYPETSRPRRPGSPFGKRRVLGDEVEVRFAPATGGTARVVPEQVLTLGRSSVVRNGDWSLSVRRADGTTTPLAGAEHAALVLSANPVLGAVVVVHTTGPGKGHTYWWRDGARKRLPIEITSFGLEKPGTHIVRWAPVLAWQQVVVDYETGLAYPCEGRVVALHERVALLARDGRAVMRDVVSGREVAVPSLCVNALFLRRAGAMCAIDGGVFDLEKLAFLGFYEGHPLVFPPCGEARAVTTDGRILLVRHEVREDGRSRARGPLYWAAPAR